MRLAAAKSLELRLPELILFETGAQLPVLPELTRLANLLDFDVHLLNAGLHGRSIEESLAEITEAERTIHQEWLLAQPVRTARLRQAREHAGLGLIAASRAVGVHHATLSRLENGHRRTTSGQMLLALADLYDVDVVELVQAGCASAGQPH